MNKFLDAECVEGCLIKEWNSSLQLNSAFWARKKNLIPKIGSNYCSAKWVVPTYTEQSKGSSWVLWSWGDSGGERCLSHLLRGTSACTFPGFACSSETQQQNRHSRDSRWKTAPDRSQTLCYQPEGVIRLVCILNSSLGVGIILRKVPQFPKLSIEKWILLFLFVCLFGSGGVVLSGGWFVFLIAFNFCLSEMLKYYSCIRKCWRTWYRSTCSSMELLLLMEIVSGFLLLIPLKSSEMLFYAYLFI